MLPDDVPAVCTSVELLNAAMEVDDPTSPRDLVELSAGWLRYGWDLEPEERYLYVPPGSTDPVGVLGLEMPTRDNRHLIWAEVTVAPRFRRQGHGTAIVAEVLRRARETGRTTIWLACAHEHDGTRDFLRRQGFSYASHDARRRQQVHDVDAASVEQLWTTAGAAAADYRLERMISPVSDEVLAELVEVTAAINDAPMGDLTYEDEVFDVDRLRAMETARAGIGQTMYRVIARHRRTGEVAGHTLVVTYPGRPTFALQGDTAVARQHRGHQLGLLLKIDMMHWLADVEPELQTIETFNNADNDYMIKVNEAIGYRLSRIYDMYELTVPADPAESTELVDAGAGSRPS